MAKRKKKRPPSEGYGKRTDELLRLQHAVTGAMAEAANLAEGAERALRAICQIERWDCGEFWRADERGNPMRRVAHWASAEGAAFATASAGLEFRRGEGLIGLVWHTQQPLWIADTVTDARAARRSLARETGLHGALLCPVISGSEVAGVLAFACRRIREPEPALLQALMAAASQLGLFVRRTDAEAGLRESEERFRRTFELAGVGVAHIGLDRRFQHVNRRFCEILGYAERELLGITGRDISHPDDKDHMNAQRPRLYAGEIDAARGEKRYLRKDGSVVWVAYTLTVERDRSGKPLYEIAVYDDISARRAMEDALRDSEARFRQVVDSANEGILVYDGELRIVTANAAAARIIGLPLETLIGRPGFTSLFACVREDGSPMPPEERPTRLTVERGEPITGLVIGLKRGGEIVWLSVNTAFLRRAGEPGHYGIVSTVRDITDRRRDEILLRESESRFRSLTEMSSDFFWETDVQHRFADVVHGPQYAGPMAGMAGHAPWELADADPHGSSWSELRATMDARRPIRDFEFARPGPGGALRYLSLSGEARIAADGRFLGYRGVGRDVTDDAMARERITTLAYRDSLTGLDNRTSLVPALEKALERTRRRGTRLAGLFLDLDGFKEVNDMHGHDGGDRLLVEAAQRLRVALRSADPVARLGGDEFFVALEDLGDAAPAERVAAKLLETLNQPYHLGAGKVASVSVSIGISVFPDDAGDAATLIKHADAAMYAAKQAGKNAYRFFVAAPAANDLPGGTAASERG